ncbi:MAG: SOS response-associated peptidase [Syntrophales bacterium]|nr:SOS response-associated peptidase [Syntrophales bacterium]
MCGRFVMISGLEETVQRFNIARVSSSLSKSYNKAPGSAVAAAIQDDDGNRSLVDLYWGIPLFGTGTRGTVQTLINARSETVHRKPTFREAFKRRRCVVIADGYYEWQRRGGRRIPWYIPVAAPHPSGFAALYRRPSDGGTLPACVIVTTAANDLILPIHDRMPVILSGDQIDLWLEPSSTEPALLTLMAPRSPEGMDAWEVSTLVNSPAHDGPECIEPVKCPWAGRNGNTQLGKED